MADTIEDSLSTDVMGTDGVASSKNSGAVVMEILLAEGDGGGTVDSDKVAKNMDVKTGGSVEIGASGLDLDLV